MDIDKVKGLEAMQAHTNRDMNDIVCLGAVLFAINGFWDVIRSGLHRKHYLGSNLCKHIIVLIYEQKLHIGSLKIQMVEVYFGFSLG